MLPAMTRSSCGDFGHRVDKNIFINEIDFFSADIAKVKMQMKKQLIPMVSIIAF